MNPMYVTSNQMYNNQWAAMDNKDPLKSKTMTYSELADNEYKLKTKLKLLKAQKRKEVLKEVEEEKASSVLEEMRRKIDKNAVVGKSFPVRADEVKYPKQGVNENPLYMTSNSSFGKVQPDAEDLPDTYFPLNNKFTKAFNGMRTDSGLNTVVSRSKVHNAFDTHFY
eukprot:CAMPEP_0115029186 /NCGR_PEP_ID=MMETSP0216-20121206/36825_1 /TAXON_ID=223996 /ORGANISM="Protocruzia adherens, Strain Boccale" /LENGTH=166 /DNA_ID=CAMNT_0002405671 /DNA_START=57 /DNA_END=557 /DNA_ORIENTATION=-